MKVEAVESKAQMEAFIRLPFRLYKDDPKWVPPLLSVERKMLDPKRNPFYAHSEARHFLATSGGRHVAIESTRNLETTFAEFLGEFRKRYVLGYEPTNTTPGWHRLDIKVRRNGVDVRARPGYTAPRNP